MRDKGLKNTNWGKIDLRRKNKEKPAYKEQTRKTSRENLLLW